MDAKALAASGMSGNEAGGTAIKRLRLACCVQFRLRGRHLGDELIVDMQDYGSPASSVYSMASASVATVQSRPSQFSSKKG